MKISMYEQMVIEEKQFCLINNLMNFSKVNGLTFTSEWLLVSLGCVGFTYAPHEFHSEIVTGRSMDFNSIFERFNEFLTKELCCQDFDDIRNMRAFITNDAKRRYFILSLDQYYTPYSPNYMQNHFHTYILLLSWLNDRVLIYDNGFYELSTSNFERAIGIGKRISIYFAKDILVWKNKQSMPQFGLREMIRNFSNVHINTNSNWFIGLEGLKIFSDYFKDASTSEDYKNIYFSINRAGSVVQSRLSMADFFKQSLNGKNNPMLVDCNLVFEELASNWKRIANLTFRLSENKDNALKGRIHKHVLNAINKEQESIEKLKQIINCNIV